MLVLTLLAAACSASAGPDPTTVPAATASAVTPGAAGTTTATPPTTAAPTTTAIPPPQVVGPDPAAPSPGAPLADGGEGVAVVAAGGADLAETAGGDPFVRAHEGLVMPVTGRDGDRLRVFTPCETEAWIDGAEVAFVPRPGESAPAGPGLSLADAVVVIDAGHGGPNTGALGPTGLVEKDVNLDIARRARDLLLAAHVGTVWMTRTEGPPGADIETGLRHRTGLANASGAHALVSIHNNAEPDGPTPQTGAEVYYQVAGSESKRLAGLMMEEFRRSFAAFAAAWMGDTDAGAKPRLRSDGVTDLYGILRNSTVPAVITEGAYISNPTEEALLRTPEFRQAYAEAVYRALIRFLTTDDPGSLFTEPYERTVSPGSGSPKPECVIPAQP